MSGGGFFGGFGGPGFGGPGFGGPGFGGGFGGGPGGFGGGPGGFGGGHDHGHGGGLGEGHGGGPGRGRHFLKRAAFVTAALLLDGPADAAQIVQRVSDATQGAFTPPQDVAELAIGLLAGRGVDWALRCGVAHGALAMTTPGDTSTATLPEVERAMKGGSARIAR